MQYVLVPLLLYLSALLSNNIWCVYKAVPHHAVVATCLSTANWEEAHVLYNGCCVYTRMYIHTVSRCLFCVHCSVEYGTVYV